MATAISSSDSFDEDPMLKPNLFGQPENAPEASREPISIDPEAKTAPPPQEPPSIDNKPTLLEVTYSHIGDANVFSDVFGDQFDTTKVDDFCKKVIAASGWTGNSLELVLIEDTCLAHFAFTAALHRAVNAPNAESSGIYTASSARLLGEIRRTVVSIRELQHPNFRPGKKKTKE